MSAHQRNLGLGRLSRELALECDGEGVVTWMDERAVARLSDRVGRPLAALAVPGTEDKVRALVDRARREPCTSEVGLVVDGRVATLSARSEPTVAGFLLVASLLTEEHSRSLSQVSESFAEVASLQRQAVRDRHEISEKHDVLQRLHQELRDSNQGLVNLHGELEERTASLGRANDVKTRVVANVSHEFRTPINSILGISQILLDRLDGELTTEQEKQLRFIRSSASSLSDLVNDLLDLSKIEAGKQQLRVTRFTTEELLVGLRGIMRPLVKSAGVELSVHVPPESAIFETDQGRISQILRNLVSNALKFTLEGRVDVRASVEGAMARFDVIDTGVGIAAHDLDRVFDEFAQVEGEHQRNVRGTGIGLSISRKLAELLGGKLTVASVPGEGSTFTLVVPLSHAEVAEYHAIEERSEHPEVGRAPVLVIEDDRQTLFFYERYLRASGFYVLPARTVEDARRVVARTLPAAVVLDVMLEGDSTWGFLQELKSSERTKHVPVMVVTVVDRAQKARALGADEFWLKPVDGERLIRKLGEMTRSDRGTRVLVIDDDETSRYLMRRMLEGTGFDLIETDDGAQGVALARSERPSVIILDFVLGELTAFDVLDELKTDPRTRNIPVVIQTAEELEAAERERLARETTAILSKQNLSRELAITRIREALINAGVSDVAPAATEEAHGP